MSNDLPVQLPPIFNNTQKDLHETEIFASFPVNTFLENIAIDEEGDIFVTSLEEGVVYRINGERNVTQYAKMEGKLTGIVHVAPHSFLIAGWNKEGVPTIYFLTEKWNIVPLISLPQAYFLNGIASLGSKVFLICDSYKGCIWKYDFDTNKAEIWLQHPLLSRAVETDPMPAANGIKIFRNNVFVSNTAKQLLILIPLNGLLPGTPEIFMDKLNLDDFEFDNSGNIYATTHIYNSVVKITEHKVVTIIGGAEQGLTGSTAIAFGRREDDVNSIYVTTNGGMSLPLPTGIQEAKVIKISIKQ